MKTQQTSGPWRIQSRWPSWSKWKVVTTRPHDEKFPFDDKGLIFMQLKDAEKVLKAFQSANEGDFRIVADDSTAEHTPGPWSVSEPRRRDWGGSGEWYECSIFAGDGARHGNALAIVYLGGIGATNTGKAEVLANARLIGSAPALLAERNAAHDLLRDMEATASLIIARRDANAPEQDLRYDDLRRYCDQVRHLLNKLQNQKQI